MAADRPLLVHCVEDDAFDREHLARELRGSFRTELFATAAGYERHLAGGGALPDVAVLDVWLEDGEEHGRRLAALVRRRAPQAAVIIRSSSDSAQAILGYLDEIADNFVSKDTRGDALVQRIQATWRARRDERSVRAEEAFTPSGLAAGATMRRVEQRIPGILRSAVRAVHVHGETGTGKEVVADLFAAQLGPHVPFVRVNAAALSDSLLGSELFGHKKSSFTGAAADREGLIEQASGGWLFLDEVGLLSPQAQSALLRAIENQEVLRVGDNRPRPVDVRVLSATNEDLTARVEQGTFRRDLLQRLADIDLRLPPLGERPGEIDEIAQHLARKLPGGPYVIAETTLKILRSAPWTRGNVRELRNVLRAMTERHQRHVLEPFAIPEAVRRALGTRGAPMGPARSGVAFGRAAPDASSLDLPSLEDELWARSIHEMLTRFDVRSWRNLADRLCVPRMTLTRRAQRLVAKGLLRAEDLGPLLSKV